MFYLRKIPLMKRSYIHVLAIAIIMVSGCQSVGMGDSSYSRGYITVEKVSTPPTNSNPISANNSSIQESNIIISALNRANNMGRANISLPTKNDYNQVSQALPDQALYRGSEADAGYYIKYENSLFRLSLSRLL